MKLIVMRHGKCYGIDENIVNGWKDYPLTLDGRLECVETSKELSNILGDVQIDKAYSSCLSRAFGTARIILDEMENDIEVKEDLRLNEKHYGIFQGMKREEAMKYSEYRSISISSDELDKKPILISDEEYEKELDEYAVKLNKDKESLRGVLPRGESIRDVENRVKDFLSNVILKEENNDKTILLVGHANTVKMIVKQIDKLNYEEVVKLRFSECGTRIYDLKFVDGEYKVEKIYNYNKEYVN